MVIARSVLLAIGWSRIAPRLGLSFALAPGWEESVGYFSEDNRVREALGVETDDDAEKKLLKIIKSHKAGTLVKLEIAKRILVVDLEYSDDRGVSGYVKQAIIIAMATTIGTFEVYGIKIGPKTVMAALNWIDQKRIDETRETIAHLEADITDRISKRATSTSSSRETFERPRAFGSKN